MTMTMPVPQQERSRRTLERLLDAGIEVLSEESLQSATAARIAARAGYTVGAFYSRFPSKEAMWVALVQRVGEHMRLKFDPLDALDPEEVRLRGAVEAVVNQFVSMYTDHSSLMIAVRRPAHVQPELAGTIRQLNEETLQRLARILGQWKDEVTHPNPKRAIDIALLMMATTLREYLLQDVSRLTSDRPISTKALAREVADSTCAYLTAGRSTP